MKEYTWRIYACDGPNHSRGFLIFNVNSCNSINIKKTENTTSDNHSVHELLGFKKSYLYLWHVLWTIFQNDVRMRWLKNVLRIMTPGTSHWTSTTAQQHFKQGKSQLLPSPITQVRPRRDEMRSRKSPNSWQLPTTPDNAAPCCSDTQCHLWPCRLGDSSG